MSHSGIGRAVEMELKGKHIFVTANKLLPAPGTVMIAIASVEDRLPLLNS